MTEYLVCDEQRPGIELIEFHGGPGYDEERITIQNGLSNGLRILVIDDNEGDPMIAHFHIKSPDTAKRLARRLMEWADRITDPPEVDINRALEPVP